MSIDVSHEFIASVVLGSIFMYLFSLVILFSLSLEGNMERERKRSPLGETQKYVDRVTQSKRQKKSDKRER